MSAAHDLVNAGHTVTIFEAAAHAGGLAAGFKEPGWQSSVEQFYHHWFQSDSEMLGLIRELGWSERVSFPRPKTVVYHNGKFHPLDSVLAALTFPGFKFFDMVRFGLVTVYLRFLARWKPLEKSTADAWMRRWYGGKLYSMQFEPLLQGKFGPFVKEVNMAWFWARLKTRTTRLGTYRGGFQQFADDFAANLRSRGVEIHLSTPVKKIAPLPEGGLQVEHGEGGETFDRVLVTLSPGQMAKLAPDLPGGYLQGLLNLKSMGAVVMVLSLDHQLSKEGYYWYNIPKSAGFPFLALVEHTNFVPADQFGGEHLIYIGDYLETAHEHFTLTKEQLLERFLPSLTRINPDFKPDWVQKTWLFRTNYAQPVPLVNHSQNIPAIQTPIPGLYFASMSQVYPWDRGTNFAVQIGRQAARLIISK
jgi:protoporphyrinogen oxidase